MKTKGLQIGNLIQDKHGNIEIVNQLLTIGNLTIDKYIDRVNDAPYDEYYSPISLTEEWLLKLGFEKRLLEVNENCIYYNLGMLKLMLSANNSYGCSFEPEDINSWFTEIQFVHQLQNIFHALTGEELTINQ